MKRARRSIRATGRCPACGRLVPLGGVSGTVILPHTTRAQRRGADGEITRHAGGPCPASCTRLRRPGGGPRRPRGGGEPMEVVTWTA